MDIATRARDFAIWAHDDQMYGELPYVVHLEDVVGILRQYGFTDDDTVAAGYLHDVLEDSKLARYDDLGFVSENVRRAMLFCTDAEGATRKERKAETLARCRGEIHYWKAHARDPKDFPDAMTFLPMAVRVKVADRLANLRNCIANNPSLLQMYQKEGMAFYAALYTPGICDTMWSEYRTLLPKV